MKKRNFTLIEHLVVIAIIAILTSMLLPALSKARDMAKRSAYSNQLKQFGIAFNMYSSDFNSLLPPPKNQTNGSMAGIRIQINGLPCFFPVIYTSSDVPGHMLSGGEIWSPVSAKFMRVCYELDKAMKNSR